MLLGGRRGSWNSLCEFWFLKNAYIIHTIPISLINSDNTAVEEEVYYEQPGPKRKVKVPPPLQRRPEL